MTGRERILAAFRGESADAVPFAPNIYYWFYAHRLNGSLPPEIARAEHPFEVLRYLGAEILARWDTQQATREVYTAGQLHEEFSGVTPYAQPVVTAFNTYAPHKNVRRQTFATPYGTLTHAWTLSAQARTDFESELWWKTWDEYEAVRFMLESRRYVWDEDEFVHWVDRVGDDGIVMVHLTCSPLKALHWLAGPENATLFLMDHPREMEALARIHQEQVLELLWATVDHPAAEVFVLLDNLGSDWFSPRLYRNYCDEFFSRAAEIIHSRGKIFVVHACGRNRALLPLVGASRIDCLEGLTPPPLGDVELSEARRMAAYERFTVNGGMDTPHLEAGTEDAIHAYTRALFASMGDEQHFIFSSSCTTPAPTPWANLIHFRDAAREYGVQKLRGRLTRP